MMCERLCRKYDDKQFYQFGSKKGKSCHHAHLHFLEANRRRGAKLKRASIDKDLLSNISDFWYEIASLKINKDKTIMMTYLVPLNTEVSFT